MAQKEYNHVDGALLVDKPVDWSSFDVVNFIRRRFNLNKTGHCGTLDPFATGLLVVLMGKATRMQDKLMAEDKVYSGTILLGVETDSSDLTGNVVATADVPKYSLEELQQLANEFLGDGQQIPPMHSAIKVNGRPLYKLARAGEVIERPPRPIHIGEFTLSNLQLPQVDFLVRCSKGTYIRTLAADLGKRAGCGAHLTALRRMASGTHQVEKAYSLDEIRQWDVATLQANMTPLAALETP